jgi:hypothetical protein
MTLTYLTIRREMQGVLNKQMTATIVIHRDDQTADRPE